MAACERIMLVEDDRDCLELTAELIEQSGVRVVRCGDAETALEALRSGFSPDLVLLDLSMPNMSGAELLEIMRADERWRAVPVVAMSGFSEEHYPHLAVDAFISKPFEPRELEAAVERLCGTKSSSASAA